MGRPVTYFKYPKLVEEMLKHNETQYDLSVILGISKTSVNYKFTGRHLWTIGEIEKLCEHYNKDYYELFK